MKLVFGVGSNSAMSIPTEWAEGLRGRGHTVQVVASTDGKLNFAQRLHRAIRDTQPAVVHLHHTFPAALSPLLRSKSFGTVLTVHRVMDDMDAVSRAGHLLGAWSVDAVIANSDATLASFPANLRRKQYCATIHNGVDLTRLDSQRNGSGPTEGPIRILSVGRLIHEKGFDTLLHAIAALRTSLSVPFRVTIVGGGPLMSSLRKLASELQLNDVVEFTGMVPREDVYRRLWQADVFVLASRTEGFCNAAVEAMAARLPVVVTPAGALPEVVADAGAIARDTSAAALADALRPVLESSRAARAQMGAVADARARGTFSLASCLTRYEQLYDRLASEPRT